MTREPTHYAHKPLKITIEGVEGASGKTLLQSRLAGMLAKAGHAVTVSDETLSESVFRDSINRLAQSPFPEDDYTPPPVLIHVRTTSSASVPDELRTPERWPQ